MPVQMPTDDEILAIIRKDHGDPDTPVDPEVLRGIKRLINTAWKAERLQEMNDERNTPPLLQFAIPQARLVDGNYYAGRCRNANIARWNAQDQQFYHWRTKFNRTFIETIDYWVVDGQFDGFIPLFDLGADVPQFIPFFTPAPKEAPDELPHQ